MSIAFRELNPEEVRRRLRAMTDAELLKAGKGAAFMCTPEANYGKPPCEEFVLHLREARAEWKDRQRIRGSLSINSAAAIDPSA